MFVACMTLATASGVALTDEVPLISGGRWTMSMEQSKKVFVATVIQVDTTYRAANPLPDAPTPAFLDSIDRAMHVEGHASGVLYTDGSDRRSLNESKEIECEAE